MGHLTEDLTEEGPRLGGAAAFAGLLAHRFGASTTILTAADAAFPFLDALAGIRLVRLPSADRTRFENRYRRDGRREQWIHSRAAVIPESAQRRAAAELPPGSAILYAPVAQELGGAGPLRRSAGAGSLAGAIPQGLLRRWDAAGRVSVSWPRGLARRLVGLDLISLADEEVEDEILPPVPVLALTRGRDGAVLRRRGLPDLAFPAATASEVDPTGAGDVFAAALFLSLWRGVALEASARLAAAAAAITVESPGVVGVPTLEAAIGRDRRGAPRATAGRYRPRDG